MYDWRLKWNLLSEQRGQISYRQTWPWSYNWELSSRHPRERYSSDWCKYHFNFCSRRSLNCIRGARPSVTSNWKSTTPCSSYWSVRRIARSLGSWRGSWTRSCRSSRGRTSFSGRRRWRTDWEWIARTSSFWRINSWSNQHSWWCWDWSRCTWWCGWWWLAFQLDLSHLIFYLLKLLKQNTILA